MFIGWSSLTLLWAFSIGLGGSPDEPAHIVKAVAVADGQFQTSVVWSDGAFGSSVPRTNVEVSEAFGALHSERTCWTGDTSVPASCMGRLTSTETTAADTYVGTYPPAFYLAVGWPSLILEPEPAVYGMRVVAALIAAAFLAEGTYHLLRRRLTPYTVAGIALAVPPSVLLLTSSVNPSGVEIASAFCLWAVTIGLSTGLGSFRRQLVAGAVAATALTWTRPLGPAYLLLIVAIAMATLVTSQTWAHLRGSRAARMLGAAVMASCAAAVIFALVNRSYSSLITYSGMEDRSPLTAARLAAGDLGDYLHRGWGLLGWQGNDTLMVPAWVTLPWLIGLAAFVLIALTVGTARQRIGLVILTLGCLVGPIVPSALSPGTPWQGRYMLPLLVGVPLLSGTIISRSSAITWALPARTIATMVVGLVSAGYLVAHQHLMNRTAVGLPARPLANLSADSWSGPIAPLALFAWALVASIGWAAMMIRAARSPSQR